MSYRYLVVFLFFLLFGSKISFAKKIEGEYLIKLKPGVVSASFHTLGENVTRYKNIPGLYHKKLNSSALNTLQSFPKDMIEYIEPVYEVSIIDTKKEKIFKEIPQDLDFSKQWGLENDKDTDVDAKKAWNLNTGSDDILVAIIDTGIDYNHPDLDKNSWKNKNETPGNNIDDDNNGYVDDIYGWNFSAKTSDPKDDHGHGTHCAGIVAAQGKFAWGVAPNVKVMALKFLTAGGGGTTAAAIEAIDYAISMKANVLSNSWGGIEYSQALEEVVQRAEEKGILTVAAAGNYGDNIGQYPMYPAALKVANMLAVANIDIQGNLSSSSNYSEELVHLGAPGTKILSTFPGNSYATLTGTSMAAPFVSGAAALLISYKKTLKYADLKKYLMTNVKMLSSLKGKTITGGTLSAGLALEALAADSKPKDPNDNPKDPNDDPKDPNDDPKDPNDDPKDPNDDPKDPNDDPKDPNDDPKDPNDDENEDDFNPDEIKLVRSIDKKSHEKYHKLNLSLEAPFDSYTQLDLVTYYYMKSVDEGEYRITTSNFNNSFEVRVKTKMPTQIIKMKIRLLNGEEFTIVR